METNVNYLNSFLQDEERIEKEIEKNNNGIIIKKQKDGLFEKVNKTLITEDGRTLLRD